MTPDRDPRDITPNELAWRLKRLEDWTTRFEEKHDRQVADLQHSIGSLGYVRQDLYDSEHRSMSAELAETRRLAMWAVALVVSVTIGAIVTGILTAGGVFS